MRISAMVITFVLFIVFVIFGQRLYLNGLSIPGGAVSIIGVLLFLLFFISLVTTLVKRARKAK